MQDKEQTIRLSVTDYESGKPTGEYDDPFDEWLNLEVEITKKGQSSSLHECKGAMQIGELSYFIAWPHKIEEGKINPALAPERHFSFLEPDICFEYRESPEKQLGIQFDWNLSDNENFLFTTLDTQNFKREVEVFSREVKPYLDWAEVQSKKPAAKL